MSTKNRCFTDEELLEMGRAPKDVAIDAIRAGNKEKSEDWINKYAGTHIAIHDLYLDWTTNLMSYIYDNYGLEKLQEAMTKVVSSYYVPMLEMMKDLEFRQKVEMSVSSFFGHGTPIKVVEDDEKVTFWMMPCGGGQAQIKAGAYDSGKYSTVEATNITWGLPNFPMYCVHAPTQDILSINILGYPLWVYTPCEEMIDKSAKSDKSCGVSIYKDPKNIPKEAYTRVGLEKPAF